MIDAPDGRAKESPGSAGHIFQELSNTDNHHSNNVEAKMRPLASSVLIIALFASMGSASAFDGPLEQVVLAELPQALSKMEAYFSNFRANGTEYQEFLKDEKKTKFKNEFHFECDGPNKLSQRVTGVAGEEFKEFIDASNRDYRFSLSKVGKAPTFVINEFVPVQAGPPPSAAEYPTAFRAELGYATGYPAAAYSAFGMAISRIMSSPGFNLKKATRVKEGGEDLIKIDFEFKPDKDYPTIRAWLMVDPARGWATRKYEGGFGAQGKVMRRGTVEYGDPDRGIPIPKRVTQDHPSYHHVFEFTSFESVEPGSLTPSLFRLSGYALPEVGAQPATARGFRGDVLLIVLGSVLGVAAIWYTWHGRSTSAVSPTRLSR